MPKKQQSTFNSDIYLKPATIVQMAIQNEASFIKLLKTNKVTNLAPLVGYEGA